MLMFSTRSYGMDMVASPGVRFTPFKIILQLFEM